MKKTFYSKSAAMHFNICLIAFAVVTGIHLVNWLYNDNTMPRRPETVKLEKPATLHGRVDNEDFEIKVKKGAEIKILGARRGVMLVPERLWVELEDGSRGFIYCTDFDLEFEAQLKDKKRLTPVKVKDLKDDKIVCELKDGEVVELYCDDVYPKWPRSWKFDYLNGSTYCTYISKEKFERKYLGSTLEENDKRMLPARNVVKKGGMTYASYPMWVLDTSDGMRYAPTVIYDETGEAKSYIQESSMKRARFFLKVLPFVGPIVDVPFFNSLIQGTLYNKLPDVKGDSSLAMKVIGWILMIIYLAFVLLWLYATPMIPVLLLCMLMHNPKIFYPLSNKVLNGLMLVITIVSSYVWGALLVGWGIMWLFLLPLPFAVLFIYGFACAPLMSSAPCGRCLNCRNIETMEFIDTVYDHEYKEWNRESKYVKKLSEWTNRWTTWTNVTRKYADGHSTTTKENIQHHSETHTTSLYDDYNVLYNVTVYKNNYKCCVCGQREHSFSNTYKEIDRKYLGTHTETHVS